MSGEIVPFDPLRQDEAMLERAKEILDLLKRSVRLGYSITLTPEAMADVIRIFEDALIEKIRP